MQGSALAATFAITLVFVLSSAEAAALVDFETIPGVGIPSEGDPIGNQYEPTEGVSFSLEGGGLPVIAEVGAPRTAFAGPPGNTGNDNPAAGVDLGSFFLTDDGVVGGIPPALIIAYTAPVAAASAVIVDIDGTEAWLIEARGATDAVLETTSLSAGDPGTGDGEATPWSFTRATPDIHSIRIVYTGQQNIVGLALDNFSPSRPASPVPVFSSGLSRVLASGLLVAGGWAFFWRRRSAPRH